MFMLWSLIPNVDKVAKMSLALIALKHHFCVLEISLKFWTRFVQGIILVKKLNHKNAEVLLVSGLDGNSDFLYQVEFFMRIVNLWLVSSSNEAKIQGFILRSRIFTST